MNTAPVITENAWDRITASVKDVFGWSPIEQLYSLYLLAATTEHLGGDIIEVGSWGGRSAIALGLAAANGPRKVHAIDYFPDWKDWYRNPNGTFSFETTVNGKPVPGHATQTVWKEPFENQIAPFYHEHPHLQEYFEKNVAAAGLQNTVHAFKGNSLLFAQTAPKDLRASLVYIDAEHSYEAVRDDIERLTPFLLPGGFICFDDAFTSYEGVDRAITEHVIHSGLFHSPRQLTRKLFAAVKR